MTHFAVAIRKNNSLKEVVYTVEADSEANAKAEASRIFQWVYGSFPRSNQFVSVVETHQGRLIRVFATSKKGKQLIKKHGDVWRIAKGPKPMQCFSNEIGYYIETVDGCEYGRNIKLNLDKVFDFWTFLMDDK